MKKRKNSPLNQQPLPFKEFQFDPSISDPNNSKKIVPDFPKIGILPPSVGESNVSIPALIIKTRWERLQSELGNDNTTLKAIIRPIPEAVMLVRTILSGLQSTSGCKVLVIRAQTGSGKTTFLNTLYHYMPDVPLKIQTIDMASMETGDHFHRELWKRPISNSAANIIILEGRETPGDISSEYIDVVISNINRYSRQKNLPMLFVVPTNEDTVARRWCEVASKTGGLSPTNLPGGQQWYDFPGVPKKKYVEIAEETVRVLNSSKNITEFGISPSEIITWADTSNTIGQFLEILAEKNAIRRTATTQKLERRMRVWIVYCCPDRTAYDQLYNRIDSLVKDDKFVVAPDKLIKTSMDNSQSREYLQEGQYAKLLTAINFLDVRLINLPIVTMINAALTYGNDELIRSFADTSLKEYQEKIPEEMWRRDQKIMRDRKTINDFGEDQTEDDEDFDWDEPINRRKRQVKNALDSLQSTNLFYLLREFSAQPQRGGNKESSKQLAQFLHLMANSSSNHLSYCIGCAIRDLLEQQKFPGYLTLGTETPYISGQLAPRPDVTIYTEDCDYLLEFHFSERSLATSELARYAVERVIRKYMADVPVLKSILDNIK